MKYELSFNNRWNEDIFIAGYDATPSEVFYKVGKDINKFCKERGYEIPYKRIWNSGGRTKFDVGSHVEFFVVIPEIPQEVYSETYSSD